MSQRRGLGYPCGPLTVTTIVLPPRLASYFSFGSASVRDPQPYLDTIERVKEGLEYLARSNLQSQQKVMLHMNDLIELGSRNIGEMIKDWVGAESPAEGIDLQDLALRGEPLPYLSLPTIEATVPLLSFLKTLPSHPKTHHAPFSSALVGYSELRSRYMDASLAPLAQRLTKYSRDQLGASAGHAGMTAAWQQSEDEAGYSRGSSGLSIWITATLDMAEVSRQARAIDVAVPCC